MNFETGPFFAASAALISSGHFDRRLAFIAWEISGRDAALRRPRVARRESPSFGRRSAPSLPSGSSVSFGIQPAHVIGYTRFKGELRLIAQCAAHPAEIGLGEILVMGVRVLDVIGLKIGA